MKPPSMAGLLGYFDCRSIDPLTVARHLGFTTDERTGQEVDGGYAAAVTLVSLLNRPYSIVPVEGDLRREFAEYGDRLRDARWLWCNAALELTCGRDGDTPDAGGPVQGDLITRTITGETYVCTRVLEHGAAAKVRGYLLLRRVT